MEKEFVPYEEALVLKELGFDEPCFGFYIGDAEIKLFMDALWETRINSDFIHHFMVKDTSSTAPLYQQAFRWFWDKHGKFVDFFVDDDKTFGFMISYFVPEGRADMPIQYKFKTYEEAQLTCLRKLIEIVKQNKPKHENL